MEKTNNTDNPVIEAMMPKKTRHHLWGLWIPLIVLAALIVIPVGLAYACFFDSGSVDCGITEKTDNKDEFNRMLVASFDPCSDKTNPNVSIDIKQQMLNQVIYNSTADNTTLKEFVPGFKCSITSDAYNFEVKVNLKNVFQTKVLLETKVDISPEGFEGFVFNITNVKIGRIGGLGWVLTKFNIDPAEIEKNIPLTIHFDLANLRMTYSYIDFIYDLTKMGGSSMDMFTTLMKDLLVDKKFSFSHVADDKASAVLSLKDYQKSTLNNIDEFNLDFDLSSVTTIVEKMLKDGTISATNNDQVNGAQAFLLFGDGETYALPTAYRSIAETLFKGDSEAAVKNRTAYLAGKAYDTYCAERQALFGIKGKSIEKIVVDELNEYLDDNIATLQTEIMAGNNVTISVPVTDTNLHDMLKSSGAVGYATVLSAKNADNSYNISTILVDNFYLRMEANRINMVFGMNINGCETQLSMAAAATEKKDGSITFDATQSDVYFGDYKLGEAMRTTVFDIMNQVGTTMSQYIQFNQGKITVNLKDAIDANADPNFITLNALATTQGYDIAYSIDSIGDTLGRGHLTASVSYTK